MKFLRNLSIKTRIVAGFIGAAVLPSFFFIYIIKSGIPFSSEMALAASLIILVSASVAGLILSQTIESPVEKVCQSIQCFLDKHERIIIRDNGKDEFSDLINDLNILYEELSKEASDFHKNSKEQNRLSEDNRIKLNSLEKQLLQTRSLLHTARILNTTIDFQTNLKTILDEAVKTLGIQWASILLIDREKNEMKVVCLRGIEQSLIKSFDEDSFPSVRIKPHEGLAGQVIREALPLIANKGSQDPRFKQFSEFKGRDPEIANLLCAPILGSDNKPLGVINFVNKTSPSDEFCNADLPYANDICVLASLVIERNSMYSTLFTDKSTGLSTYSAWKGFYEEEINRAVRYAQNTVLIAFQIDNLNEIRNETDDQFADQIFIQCGRKIRAALRETDKGTIHQDYFLCILPNTDASGGVYFAGRLKEAAGLDKTTYQQTAYSAVVSAGIAALPDSSGTNSANKLKEKALSALKEAKASGGGRVIVA